MAESLGEIARRIGVNVTPLQAGLKVECLLTDSRSLVKPDGAIFFALHTRSGDGHFYLRNLYEKGVRMFVVERVPENMRRLDDAVMLLVPDVLKALQAAGRPQSGYSGTTIAVCGSRGKTVVKEWLYSALKRLPLPNAGKAVVARSPRSFNSQTGVPLSLWQVPAEADYAVIEAGISQAGEMETLADMIQPRIALFTGLDAATHSEGFADICQKAEQKAVMARNADVAICSADVQPLVNAVIEACNGRTFFWSRTITSAPVYIYNEKKEGAYTLLTLRSRTADTDLRLPFVRESEVDDAIAVCVALLALGYGEEQLQSVLSELKPVRTRLDVVEGVNGCTVAVDGYEADLASLPLSLDFMRRHSSRMQRLTLVISDLQDAESIHYQTLADMLCGSGINRVIAVGAQMMRHKRLFDNRVLFFDDAKSLLASLSVADFSGEFVMIKSTPADGLESVAEMLAARKHETVLEVNLGALARNYSASRRHLPEGTRIVAMVKASAYGMGSYEVARTLQDAGADYLAVAVLDEGLELRRRGITMPIMVMNPKVVNYRSMFANSLEPEIYSPAMLDDVIGEAVQNDMTNYPVHIKLDTGMHRTGFTLSELPELCRRLESQSQVRPASVFSHLATADCLDMDKYTLAQIDTFKQMTAYMSEHLSTPFLRHILNSAGIVRFPQYSFEMARLGIGLYGVNTLPASVENAIEPVASLRTVIIALHDLQPGDAVGYGRAGKILRPSRIATLPIGYADGFNRHFGCGAISVYVNGKLAPTIGNVCMDQCMIDVTGIDCAVGDDVEIFGAECNLQRLADALHTIPYEVLTSISPRVKRIYYRE